MLGPLKELAEKINLLKIRVLTVPKANKRLQMVTGIRNTTTDILVFADDDAIWKPETLKYIFWPTLKTKALVVWVHLKLSRLWASDKRFGKF
jgi:hypothetical protein